MLSGHLSATGMAKPQQAVQMAIVPVTPAGSIAVPLSLISGQQSSASLSVGRDTLLTPIEGLTLRSVANQTLFINNIRNGSNNSAAILSAAPISSTTVVLAHPVLLSASSGCLSRPVPVLVTTTALSAFSPAKDNRQLLAPCSQSITLASVTSNPPPPPLIPQLPSAMSLSTDEAKSVPEVIANSVHPVLPVLTAVPVTAAPELVDGTASSSNGVKVESDAAVDEGKADEEPIVTDVPLDFETQSVMNWTTNVGTLTHSNLKFKMTENGSLQLLADDEEEKVKSEQTVKQQANGSPVCNAAPDEETRTCVHCGKSGPLKNFIRAGKFCSQECATSQATQLKSLVRSLHSDAADIDGRNLKSGLKPDGRSRHTDIGRGSPLSEKRKQMLCHDSPQTKVRRGVDDENEENNEDRHRTDGKLKSGRFVKKSRAKELRNEDATSLIDSEKLSLPSSPSSSLVPVTPQSALHQSIFSMRVLQHQQEPPLGWERHSKNLHPVLQGIRPSDVLHWDPDKVAAFVNTIPGCRDIGQTFADELIDGEAFLLLNQQDIVKVLNVKLGPAVKIYNAVVLFRDAIEL